MNNLFFAILFIVVVGSHDVAQFFLKDPDSRRFWLKWWLALAIAVSVIIWLIVLIADR